jgi:large subunit ribosomal protein L24
MSRPASPPQKTRVIDIRKGDTVLVLTGKDASKRGTVERVIRPDRVVIDGVNLAKKHQKPRQRTNQADRVPQMQQGGIIDIAQPLHMSNVMIVCSRCDQPTRVGHAADATGKFVRICKKCGEPMEVVAK